MLRIEINSDLTITLSSYICIQNIQIGNSLKLRVLAYVNGDEYFRQLHMKTLSQRFVSTLEFSNDIPNPCFFYRNTT